MCCGDLKFSTWNFSHSQLDDGGESVFIFVQPNSISICVFIKLLSLHSNTITTILTAQFTFINSCRSQWPRGLRRRSAAAGLLRSWVRIQPETWMFVCCDCCVFSGRGLYVGLITRPEEFYRLWCVVVFLIYKPREWGDSGPLGRLSRPKRRRKNS